MFLDVRKSDCSPRGTGHPFPGRQRSFVHWSAMVVIALASGVVSTFALIAGPLPIPNGSRFASQDWESPGYSFGYQPPADTNLGLLLASWRTPLEFATFLESHGRYVTCTNAVTFVKSYRRSTAEFQANHWHGDCNDFAHSVCEVAAMHGYQMGFISLWPKHWRDLFAKDWHQVAVLCLERDREYVIFDNGSPFRWRGSLAEYADSIDKKIIPFGGQLNWRPTRENPLARFVDQFRFNETLTENRQPLKRGQQAPNLL